MKKKVEKNRGKRRGEARGKRGKKKRREKSQLTLGQWVDPTNSRKILSDDNDK